MPTLEHARRFKSLTPVEFKAEGQGGLKAGEFEAYASVFGNIDSYGERLVKGAFADTLAAWSAKGDPVPVIWQHNWADPKAHIGYALAIEERDEGLWYKGVLDVDDNDFAAQVYRLMKGRRVTQQSFGYDVIDASEIVEDGKSVFEITKVDLFEVGPCLVGVNQATDLLDIKSNGGVPISGPPERSGQASATAADDQASAPTGSVPSESSASKGLSPASVQLALTAYELLGRSN